MAGMEINLFSKSIIQTKTDYAVTSPNMHMATTEL